MHKSHYAFPFIDLTLPLYSFADRAFLNAFPCARELIMLNEETTRSFFSKARSPRKSKTDGSIRTRDGRRLM